MWLNGDRSPRAAVHELGHHLGLHHAASQHCYTPTNFPVPLSTNCTTVENGDALSAMGGLAADLPDEYTPSQQSSLGWNEAWTTTVSAANFPRTYFLTPVEDTPAPGATQTLRLLFIDSTTEDLRLDYHREGQAHQTIGFDSYTSGLLVHRETNPSRLSPALLFMNREESLGGPGKLFHPNMFVGQSWTSLAGTLTITLNSADTTGASVTIQFTPSPPPPDRVVPDVIGQNRVTAENMIRAAGLTVGAVHTRVDPSCANLNNVSSQSQPGGTHVPLGSAIGYTYWIPDHSPEPC